MRFIFGQELDVRGKSSMALSSTLSQDITTAMFVNTKDEVVKIFFLRITGRNLESDHIILKTRVQEQVLGKRDAKLTNV